jgi:hypothetical protein
VLAGSALPAFLFLLWNGIILGSVPPDAANAAAAGEIFDPNPIPSPNPDPNPNPNQVRPSWVNASRAAWSSAVDGATDHPL